ncbi:MAG: AI-2E family transporter, partial [Ktedonobacterales bacterium]
MLAKPREDDATAELHRTRARHWAQRRDTGLALVCWAALLAGSVWLLSHILRAVVMLIIAALLAYALAPFVAYLRRWLPRWLAILLVYAGLLAVLGLFGYLLVTASIEQVRALIATARHLLTPGANDTPSPLIEQLHNFGISQQQLDDFTRSLATYAETLGRDLLPLLSGLASGVLDAVLILVVSVYLLMDGARVGRWLRTGTPRRYRPRVVSTLDTFQRVVGGYIRGQVTLSALIGVLVGGGMALFHVPFPILLGALAFVFSFIPILGTVLSGAICVLIALSALGPGWAVVVLAYFIGVHLIEGDFVGPRIVGKAVGLHPAVSILALIAGSELFGIFGALLAAPVAGVVQALIADFWIEWRKSHPDEFADAASGAGAAVVETV